MGKEPALACTALFPRPMQMANIVTEREGCKTAPIKDIESEVRNTTGMSKVEKLCLVLVLVILAAIAVPVLLRLNTEAQLKTNRINLRTLRQEALIAVQVDLGDTDSTTPDGRRVSEGIKAGAGWVALAYVDGDNNMSDLMLFVVDDIGDYQSGIAPGRIREPVPAGSDVEFYTEPKDDWTSDPFAHVKPAGGGSRVYTVQVAIAEAEVDLVPVR